MSSEISVGINIFCQVLTVTPFTAFALGLLATGAIAIDFTGFANRRRPITFVFNSTHTQCAVKESNG